MTVRESILNSVPSQYFPLTVVVGCVATIATTYTLSTYQGHTQPFPYTDITHTGLYWHHHHHEYLLMSSILKTIIPFFLN